MSKKIITISREFGSGGRSIGKEVAKQLGISYYDKELIKKTAAKTGFDEKFIEEHGEYATGKSFLSYFSSFMGSNIQKLSAADFLWVMQRQIILDLAETESCVIVGRCSDYILKDRKDCLHVFIHADWNIKQNELYGSMEKQRKRHRSVCRKKTISVRQIINIIQNVIGEFAKTIICL